MAINARQMLAGLPVRMAEGGEAWTPGESVGRQRALEGGNEAAWLAQVKASADAYMARATPATAAEAYDAMVQSGIGIKDLLDAGVSQATIDKALSVETDAEQKAINNLTRTALTNTLAQNPSVAGQLASRGAQDVYSQSAQFVRGLQNEGMSDDERRQLQQVASQQGWGFSDIRAAGVDPTVLFKPFTAPVAKPPVPTGPGPAGPGGYNPVTVYQPLPSQPDIFAPGEPALDTAFRNSPPRTVSPVTGQYMYTPAASLRPATGAGMSWTPPVVTSRPRQLLDVAPTASASQLYAQTRQEQDRALRNAFSSAKIPARGMDVYDWQSRLRSGEYTNPTGMFDSGKFNQDFMSWSANRGTGQTPAPTPPDDYYEGSLPRVIEGQPLQPQMFLGFADGGDVRARELLDRLKKSEGAEAEALGAEDTYSAEPGTLDFVSEKVGRGARALRDIAVNLTPLSQMEKDATRISLEHFPDSKQYGGESDALRHMLFQAQAVQRFGQPAAKAISLINEYGLGILEAQPKEHIRMDLGNDALGREIGLSGLSEEEQLRAILDLIESGKASVVNPQQQDQEFADGGLATAPSPRMARAAQLAAQRAGDSQTESAQMLERLLAATPVERAVFESTGMEPGLDRASILPFAGSREEGNLQLAAPGFAYDAARAFVTPGMAARGQRVSDEDIINTAMNVMGGGVGASQVAGPRIASDEILLGMAAKPAGGVFMPNFLKDSTGAEAPSGLQDALERYRRAFSNKQMPKDVTNTILNKADKYFKTKFGTADDPLRIAVLEGRINPITETTGTSRALFRDYLLAPARADYQRLLRPDVDDPTPSQAREDFERAYDSGTGLVGRVFDINNPTGYGYEAARGAENKAQALLEEQGVAPQLINLEYTARKPGDYNSPTLEQLTSGEDLTLKKAFENTEPIFDLTSMPRLPFLNPNYLAEGLEGIPLDKLERMSFPEMVIKAASIMDKDQGFRTALIQAEAGKKVPKKYLEEGVRRVMAPNAETQWVRITDPKYTKLEGNLMGHSVGGYANRGGYNLGGRDAFNAGVAQIYSLRDSRTGLPRITVEIENQSPEGSGINNPRIKQVQGFKNGLPSDVSAVFSLARHLGVRPDQMLGTQRYARDTKGEYLEDAVSMPWRERYQEFLSNSQGGPGLTTDLKGFNKGGEVSSPRMARADQLAAQRAEEPQTESRSMLERLQRFTSLDQPQDMSLGETAADIGMGFLPVVGTAQGARDFERARRDEDTLGMVLSAASMIPVAGGAVRAARSAGKAADDLAALTAKAPTDTPEFKNFFGESKVVNESGQPLRVYHGTNVDVDQFATDIRLGRKRFIPGELGTWFGSTPEVANSFARGVRNPRERGVVYPVYLNIQNPKVYDSYEDFLGGMQGRRSANTVKKELQEQGYDGIQIKNSTTDFGGLRDDWVAFKPTQIKSAIGNVGTYDPSNPVITKAKGGEVSSSPTTQELLAQIDRSMANSPATAYGTASSAPRDTVQADSRSMLRRISDAFGQNVTAPVVGSMLDMTAGVGDLAQMGIKAGADKLGVETKPFTPVSSAIQESLGVAGYDPYSPAAIATAIGLPAAAALRAAGTAARGSRPLMMSEAMPRTPRGRRPAPGSAEELLSRLAPIVDREASVYASSELAAMGAREVAPDNFTAEVAAAIAGGGAYNTLDNILSSSARTADMGAPTTARSQMAEIYRHVPTTENPFVGRLDTYVANLPGKIGKDELLAQMRGKFRSSEILRVQRALEGVDPKTKLQPNEVLEKLQAEYDPSDLQLTTITPGMFKAGEGRIGRTFYESMDNPWAGQYGETAPDRGVIVLSRPVLPSQNTYPEAQLNEARTAIDRFNDFTSSPETWSLTLPRREDGISDFKKPFWNALAVSNFPKEKTDRVYGILDEMELTVMRREQQKKTLEGLAARLSSGSQKPLVSGEAFNAEKNRLLEQGGMEPSRVVDQAYVNVFKNSFNFPEMLGREGGLEGLFYGTRAMLERLPLPQDVTTAQEADAFVSKVFLPALRAERSAARRAETSELGNYAVALQNTGVEDFLRGMLTASPKASPKDRSGVNRQYTGQHPSLTGTDPGQIGFMRTSDVVADVPGMGNAKGIYLHEMQSDLLDDINTKQGRIASGATLAEIRDSIPEREAKFSKTFKEWAGDSFAQNEEVMSRLLQTLLNDPEGARITARDYISRYPEIFNNSSSWSLKDWLSENLVGDSVTKSIRPLSYAKKRVQELESPEADRKKRTDDFSLDEAFPGMMSDSKTLQQMFMKTAVKSAMDRGMNFVALTIPQKEFSAQPQLYEKVPQNAKDVIKDLGEGFRVEQIRMRSPKDYSSNSFPVLAITWDQKTAEGREGVNRIMTRGVPFKHGGEVTTQPDDLKNLISFLDKKPAHKRK